MDAEKLKKTVKETIKFYNDMECSRDPNEVRKNNKGEYLLEALSFKENGTLRMYSVMPSEEMAERIAAFEIYATGFHDGRIGSVSPVATDKELIYQGEHVIVPAGSLSFVAVEDESSFYFTLRDYHSGEIRPLNVNNVKDYTRMVYEYDAPERLYCEREKLPPFEIALEDNREDEFGG